MSKPIIALDATAAARLMGCARKYHYTIDLHKHPKGGKSNALECGSLAHIIKEFYNKSRIAGLTRAQSILIGYEAGKEYVQGYTPINKYVTDPDEKGMLNTPKESDKYNTGWSYVFDTMDQYFNFWRNDSWTIIGAEEVRKDIIFNDDIIVLWKAKYDEIVDMPDGLMSIDTKTMKQNRDTVTTNLQFMGQCRLIKSRNIMIDKIGFQTSLPPDKKFVRVVISYSADRIAEFCNDTIPHLARMLLAYKEADYYPPNYAQCQNQFGFCEFYRATKDHTMGVCEHDRNMRDEVLSIEFEDGKAWDI